MALAAAVCSQGSRRSRKPIGVCPGRFGGVWADLGALGGRVVRVTASFASAPDERCGHSCGLEAGTRINRKGAPPRVSPNLGGMLARATNQKQILRNVGIQISREPSTSPNGPQDVCLPGGQVAQPSKGQRSAATGAGSWDRGRKITRTLKGPSDFECDILTTACKGTWIV